MTEPVYEPPKRARRAPLTEYDKAYLAAGVASGEKKADLAARLNCAAATISRTLKEPEVERMVKQFRAAHRVQNVEGAQRVVAKVWDRIDEQSEVAGDPKSLDLYTRAALNMERIAASASGELKPVTQVNITQQTANVVAEGQELIAALMGLKG